MKRAYPVIVIAVVLIVFIMIYNDSLEPKDIGNAMLALFSTFLGATLAFRLQEDKERREIANRQCKALNSSLLVLLRQYNAMAQLAKDFAKYPDDFTAAFNMPAMKAPNYDDLVHNIEDLEFLLDAGHPHLLFELTIEQERFHQSIDALNIRNEFYVGEVQKAISENKMNKRLFTAQEAESLLGDRIFGGAVNGAKNARGHITQTCESLSAASSKLRKAAKELFPDHKFIMYEIQPTETGMPEPSTNPSENPATAGHS